MAAAPFAATVTGDSSGVLPLNKEGQVSIEDIDGSTLGTKHQHKVQTVLRDLTPQQIKDLGLELGLYSNTLNRMPQTSIHGDMVHDWLIRCDGVLETSGNPSWRSLATALLNQGFGGPADIIRQQYHVQVRRNQDPPAIESPRADYSTELNGNKGIQVSQCEAYNRGEHKPVFSFSFDDSPIASKPNQELEYYDMTALMHGVAFIINIKEFDCKHATRDGTELDEINLKETFLFLGYRPVVFNDLTSEEILCLFQNLDRKVQETDDHAEKRVTHDSFVCCILSHGNEDAIYGSDSVSVNIKTIVELLVDSSKFKSRPKMLFIQACRGKGRGTEVPRPDSDTTYLERPDLYACLASISGYQSYRYPSKGSIFVTELCKMLYKYVTCLSLQSKEFKKHLKDSIREKYVMQYEDSDKVRYYVQEPCFYHEKKSKHIHFFL